MNNSSSLHRVAKQLVGLMCHGAIAGDGTGSVISVHFGELILANRRTTNPNVPERLRSHKGALVLFIECAWRLDGKDRVICGSTDSNHPGGPMLTGLAGMAGAIVSKVDGPAEPGLDLTLELGDHLKLNVFCDQVNLSESVDNYSLITSEIAYIVGPGSAVRIESNSTN
jgi:hypothetical protein